MTYNLSKSTITRINAKIIDNIGLSNDTIIKIINQFIVKTSIELLLDLPMFLIFL